MKDAPQRGGRQPAATPSVQRRAPESAQLAQLIRYCVVGGPGYVINLGLYAIALPPTFPTASRS